MIIQQKQTSNSSSLLPYFIQGPCTPSFGVLFTNKCVTNVICNRYQCPTSILAKQTRDNITWTYLEGVCYSNWRQLGNLNVVRQASIAPQLYRRHCCCRLAGHTRSKRSRLPRNRPQLAPVMFTPEL